MIIRRTRSVCPICLANIPAGLHEMPGGSIFMEKTCPRHGSFRTAVWRGKMPFAAWTAGAAALTEEEGKCCPADCGLCHEHLQGSCCVLMETTGRCNLRCRFCFADAGNGADPPLPSLLAAVRDIADRCGKPLLQLSGGEPTLREDLPELIRAAKEAGIPYVQVNTNGIRLAEDPDLAKKYAEAGLDFVFLQFDGTDDDIYRALRGREMMSVKEEAIRNSGAAGLSVTLVPTVVPGINLASLGEIVRYAASHSPVVRGVHLQPVSYFGRIPGQMPPDAGRCTLDELLTALCEQTGLLTGDFVPSRCDHPLCGFHGSFIAERGMLIPLTRGDAGPSGTISAAKNRELTARRWCRHPESEAAAGGSTAGGSTADGNTADGCTMGGSTAVGSSAGGVIPAASHEGALRSRLRLTMEEGGVSDMDVFLKKVRTQSFTLSSMPFQDAMNLDIERLRSCSLHVYRDGRIVPLCAEYLTPVRPDQSADL